MKRGDEDDGGEELFARDREYRVWSVLLFVLGVGLWVQLLGAGAWAEVQSEDGSGAILALQLLPLLMAMVAVSVHHGAARLSLFPLSFLPGMALMTDVEWAAMGEPASLMVKGGLFGLYLLVAAGRPETKDVVATPRRPVMEPGGVFEDRRFRRFLGMRVFAGVALFAVISYALFLDPQIGAAIAAVDAAGESSGRSHHSFMVILAYFGWAIALYMGTVLPILNWEYERYQQRRLRSSRALIEPSGRLMVRIMLWLGGMIIVIIGALMMLSR